MAIIKKFRIRIVFYSVTQARKRLKAVVFPATLNAPKYSEPAAQPVRSSANGVAADLPLAAAGATVTLCGCA
jgi:hypothetical protein